MLVDVSNYFEELFDKLRAQQNKIFFEVNEAFDHKIALAKTLKIDKNILQTGDTGEFQSKMEEVFGKGEIIKFIKNDLAMDSTCQIIRKVPTQKKVAFKEGILTISFNNIYNLSLDFLENKRP